MHSLRVATFNMHHGAGIDGVVELDRTADAIRATHCQAIALQEIDRGLARSGGADQAQDLAALTGLRIEFFPTLAMAGGEYGIALATDGGTDLDQIRFWSLPVVAGDEPRGVILARVGQMTLFATHLSKRGESRKLQLDALVSLAGEAPGPLLLLGDLNAPVGQLAALAKAGFLLPERSVITFPAPALRRFRIGAFVGRGIDHVLGRGIAVTGRKALRTRASDHLPLVAEVGSSP